MITQFHFVGKRTNRIRREPAKTSRDLAPELNSRVDGPHTFLGQLLCYNYQKGSKTNNHSSFPPAGAKNVLSHIVWRIEKKREREREREKDKGGERKRKVL